MGERAVSGSVDVECAPQVVFAILVDPRQHPRIDGSGSVRGTIEGPDALRRGSTFGMRMHLFGVPYRITNRVVEFEPGRLIAWRHFAGHRWRYELADLPDGSTRVTETSTTPGSARWRTPYCGSSAFQNATGAASSRPCPGSRQQLRRTPPEQPACRERFRRAHYVCRRPSHPSPGKPTHAGRIPAA